MVVHKIFVKYGDPKSNAFSLKLLRFVKQNLGVFRDIDIRFEVTEYSISDLELTHVRQSLKSLGIDRLPALVTPLKTYHGADTIIDAYVENINSYYAEQKPKPKPAAPKASVPTDDDALLNKFMDKAIGDADEPWDEDPLGEDIERSISSRFQEERQKRNKKKTPGPSRSREHALLDDNDLDKPANPRKNRPDNVGSGSGSLDKLFKEDRGPKDAMAEHDENLMARYLETTDDI